MAINVLPRLAGQTAQGGALRPEPATEKQAAERLGAVYLELARRRQTPLGTWAVIPVTGYGQNFAPFYEVLGVIYGSDSERERKYGRAKYLSRVALYKRDCDLVIP